MEELLIEALDYGLSLGASGRQEDWHCRAQV